MYIKSIVLDGFKSYGKRTEIVGFDQLFNAITGLNGSGKSNILDAICFALGLSNMSLARCTNLRELIFKNGQAGVQKAIVTVTFDNTDKAQSPTGYEHLSEIVIRREVHLNSRTKYYVCGQSATNSQVSDLFHSVQLNISNPHFLIMQGRITKVLNMKPHDILAMIEEATGVSLYEVKKKSTQATIEKKDQALKSIDLLIDETILPKLEQLRKEHANLLDFQHLVGELDKLSKQYIAWQFVQNQKKADLASQKTETCDKRVSEINNSVEELTNRQEEITNRIREIEMHNDELSGGHIARLEEELKQEDSIETKESGKLEQLKALLKETKKEADDLNRQMSKDDQLRKKKQTEYDKLRQDFDKIEEAHKLAQLNYQKAQKNYEAVTSGKALDDKGEVAATLSDQLIKATEEYNSSNTEMKIQKTKLVNLKRDLTEKKTEANKYKNQYEQDNKLITASETNVHDLKQRLSQIAFDQGAYQNLIDEQQTIGGQLKDINDQLDREYADRRINFDYSPIPGFNPNCVKGAICTLFTVKDPKYAKAVEAAASSKLFDIVVETNDQCKQLMDRGNLKRSYNLIALNKVRGKPVDRQAVDTAKKLSGTDRDVIAIQDLIEYDPSLKNAMEYVFGDTILAPDLDRAVKITYSKLRKRTVTLDGDVVMAGGDMSGGFKARGESFLIALAKLKSLREEKSQLEARLHEVNKSLGSMDVLRTKFLTLESEYRRQYDQLESTKNRLRATSAHHKMFEAVKNLEIEMEELTKSLELLQETSDKSYQRMKELKTKLANEEQSHKKELDSAQKALDSAKKDAEAKLRVIDQSKVKVESLGLEIEDLNKSCDQYKEKLDKLQDLIDEKQKAVDEQTVIVEEIKERVADLGSQLKAQKDKLREQNNEVNKLIKKRDKCASEINNKKLEIKKIQHEVEQIQSEAKDASHSVRSMLHKYDWIVEERHLFGKDNSDYPFNRKDFNVQELTIRIQRLDATKKTMQKTVNQRANLLLNDKEKEAEALRDRRSLIEEDKNKLIKYMEEVDRKKKDALHKAWHKINVDFESIFSTFLPNTRAKLDTVPGKDLLDGLEVKVAFGGVWKESLTELSGGQRSLVALSLILALLKYNPAPLYILDEVDAALDQNHTQNTGTMIKKHFGSSQFIIVSLKDDMFRNANVLFKTRFVDGKSQVARYTHSSK